MFRLWMTLWACSSPPPETGPVLVWITVDTLRADRLGFAGHAAARTPHLDALAARGRVFTHATTPLPRTTPALASALTGQLPEVHGSREVGDPMKPLPTIAEVLSAAGWRTVGVSAMQVAGPEQGFDRGFTSFRLQHDAPADAIVDTALAELGGGQRFLWVHFADPHFPYQPPGATGACAELGRRAADGSFQRVELFADVGGQATALRDDCAQLYDGELSTVDAAVGRLLAALPDEAFVVFTADHGEHLGEQGLFFEHGPTVHGANLRIPLVVAGPGVVPGVDDGLAQLTDLMPTTLARAGLPFEGVDLLAGIPRTVAVAESGSALQARLTTALVSGRRPRWCLNGPRWSWCEGKRGGTLHDREVDPGLKVDRSEGEPEVAAQMAAWAKGWGPEQGRERTAFDGTHKLVAVPVLEGGRRLELRDWDDRVVDDPEALARLAAVLGEGVPVDARERSEGELEGLRELGYVE